MDARSHEAAPMDMAAAHLFAFHRVKVFFGQVKTQKNSIFFRGGPCVAIFWEGGPSPWRRRGAAVASPRRRRGVVFVFDTVGRAG